MRNFIFILGVLLTGSVAQAQDFGIILGVQESNATASNAGWSTSGEFGFKIGGVVSAPLADKVNFRSGIVYTQRHFDLKDSAGDKLVNSFDYIDVPALVQYNFTENFGIFGGLMVAFNVNDSVSSSNSSLSTTVTGNKSLIPLVQIGFNGTFNNQYGVEAYYEQGLGDIYDGAKNFSVFGANFIYWL